jgi:hypothetical protein
MITSVTNPPPMYMISLPFEIGRGPPSVVAAVGATPKTQKADAAEDPAVFDHVGLLVNEPPATRGLLSI